MRNAKNEHTHKQRKTVFKENLKEKVNESITKIKREDNMEIRQKEMAQHGVVKEKMVLRKILK